MVSGSFSFTSASASGYSVWTSSTSGGQAAVASPLWTAGPMVLYRYPVPGARLDPRYRTGWPVLVEVTLQEMDGGLRAEARLLVPDGSERYHQAGVFVTDSSSSGQSRALELLERLLVDSFGPDVIERYSAVRAMEALADLGAMGQ